MSDSIKILLEKQRAYFSKGETKNITFRLNVLKKLKAVIKDNEKDILDALNKDLNKASFEAYATEVGFIYNELNDAIKNLKKWSKVKRVRTPITQFKSLSYIVSEPYGIVLIMSPWNYPFQLTIAPLIGAVSAGNCAVVKPSAYSPYTSNVINKIISSSFNREYIAVIEGGREANQELLHEKFDYIFFTGSVDVGKTVMESASKNLTPVTLELGGKSPCIVDKDVNIDITARRIIWGKTINSGQTCVAPDYIYVHKDV
ncbi:MAG: aldehyde dehydrogenase family protein, partial [Clostridiaceae bacterium]|nr:aldehyde dehydrogenase family protein [Clostridiaceae bacterium]